jgi:hypothetical protein
MATLLGLNLGQKAIAARLLSFRQSIAITRSIMRFNAISLL